jgi:hypothetical protein
MFKIFRTKKTDSKVLQKKVTQDLIKNAYAKRSSEIESLRLYDRGEKTITPRSLASLVQGI